MKQEAGGRAPVLAGVAEAAMIGGVTRQHIHVLRKRPGFPAPVQELACGSVWLAADLEEWFARPRRPGRPASRQLYTGKDAEGASVTVLATIELWMCVIAALLGAGCAAAGWVIVSKALASQRVALRQAQHEASCPLAVRELRKDELP